MSIWEMKTEGGVLHGELAWVVHGLEWLASGIDLFAIALLLVGAARFVVAVTVSEVGSGGARVRRMNKARIALGRYILSGLELFIVSDVIHTALSLAFMDLVFLLMLVIIRSITSFFLDRELEQLKREIAE
ncbi:DUF1622 domain-containing protein [Sagittula sp. NFXS13]|uniref:Putative membrane protein n=1 Tax=Sagittula marina TaxID=943940 RepID=A0A7W6DXY7_9RHOB|nr:DUF1622 domain-containing protein [Sagittula marina]MBB3988228.1 putative membrane protein [Sagittula marina]